jgi:hypothetical protein
MHKIERRLSRLCLAINATDRAQTGEFGCRHQAALQRAQRIALNYVDGCAAWRVWRALIQRRNFLVFVRRSIMTGSPFDIFLAPRGLLRVSRFCAPSPMTLRSGDTNNH